MRAPILLVGLLVAGSFAGCLSAVEPPAEVVAGASGFDTSRGWSVPTSPELYAMLDGAKARVPSFDGVEMSVGIFLPDVAGCDWEAESLPPECRLPTVMDAGPYYGDRIHLDKYRPPTVEWLVPRGYAVVQMSLRGTGESGGCMEFKSPKDVQDVTAVVDWLAARPWSNGAVGMTGRSYDGTGAWNGAAGASPALRTIVPISGAVNDHYLYYKNGTSELRGPLHGSTYWPAYGLGLADGGAPTRRASGWPQNLCKEALVDVHAESVRSTATGDGSSEYWRVRDLRPPILASYAGSVWVIHGLHDWNVNPSQAVPFLQEMQDAGIPVRAWLGAWAHHYPDRVDEHRNVRWDWADEAVRWFDWWLVCEAEGATDARGRPCVDPWLGVEVEDSLFVWRREATYPPRDARFHELALAPNGALAAPTDAGEATAVLAPPRSLVFVSEPLAAPLRIAGLPQLHVDATPTTAAGAHVFAELYDVFPDGRSVRIAWSGINLRYHAGGNSESAPLRPGEPVRAHLEFEPADALVAEGHRLRLVLHTDGVEDVLPSPSREPTLVHLGPESLLRLPFVERPAALEGYAPPAVAPPMGSS